MLKRAVTAAVVAGCLAVTACGSSHHPARTTTSAAASSLAPMTADQRAIVAVYTSFIQPGVPIERKVNMVQDGAAFQPAMEALSQSDLAKNVTVTVSKVTLVSANRATVIFSLQLTGQGTVVP